MEAKDARQAHNNSALSAKAWPTCAIDTSVNVPTLLVKTALNEMIEMGGYASRGDLTEACTHQLP